MAKVPTYDNFLVEPNGGRMPAVDIPDVAGAQAQQTGREFKAAGTELGKIVAEMQRETNQLRIDDANNQVNDIALQLKYDKDTGYLQQKGLKALQRESGMSLHDEYAEKLQDRISEISGTLGNDKQRALFARSSGHVLSSFRGDALKHGTQEFIAHKGSVLDGTIANRQQHIELNYGNDKEIQIAIHGIVERDENGEPVVIQSGIKQAIYQKAQLLGKDSSEFVEAAIRDATSQAHASASKTAIQKGDIKRADDIMSLYGGKNGQISGAHALEIKTLRDHKSVGIESFKIGELVAQKFGPMVHAGDMGRIVNITGATESGNRDFNANGTPVVSPTGVKWKMQVTDATAKAPGYGIKPAASKTPEEYNRVGEQLLAGLLKHNGGDVAKMWAGYNGGQKYVDQATAAAAKNGTNWFTELPAFIKAGEAAGEVPAGKTAETLKYVNRNVRAWQAGGGQSRPPTKTEVYALVRQQVGTSNPELLKASLSEADRRLSEMDDEKKRAGTTAVENAERELISVGGDFNLLSAQTKADIATYAPDKMTHLMTYGRGIKNPVTDDDTYINLRAMAANDPDRFAKEDLRKHFPMLGAGARETLIDLQMKAKDPNKKHHVATLEKQLSVAHNLLNFGNSDKKRKGTFDDAVYLEIRAREKTKGSPLTEDERDLVIKKMMLPTDSGWFVAIFAAYSAIGI